MAAARRRVLVHGAGAVGGYFGALLAAGGHDVTFVARDDNLRALRAQGLVVHLGEGRSIRLPSVHAVADPAEAPAADLVLVCVKSYDTPAAAAALRPAVGPDTVVLSLQNGIENEERLAAGLGLPSLMVALTRIGVAVVAPATIEYSGRGTILFGEPDGRTSARASASFPGTREALYQSSRCMSPLSSAITAHDSQWREPAKPPVKPRLFANTNWVCCADTVAPSELRIFFDTAKAAASQRRASSTASSVEISHG